MFGPVKRVKINIRFFLIYLTIFILIIPTISCTYKKDGLQQEDESTVETEIIEELIEEDISEERTLTSEGEMEEDRLKAINTDGFGLPGNNGIDRIIDTGEYMFLGTTNFRGTLVYRSNDKGQTWEKISEHGINGDIKNAFTTTIVWFKDNLYVGTWQLQSGAQLFRANADAEEVASIKWETITEDGFGNLKNNGFTNGIVFDGYVYVACFNLT